MKIYHFSDTHSLHNSLILPDLSDIDVMVFSGDESNYKDKYRNEHEFYNFIEWYAGVDFKGVKIMIAGNHSSYISECNQQAKTSMYLEGILYLENESAIVNGVKFFGSPYSPTFGNWHFMKSRETINRVWDLIPEDTDVLVTHTPPKGILDISFDRQGNVDLCGCSALKKRIGKLNIKANLYGHIHSCSQVENNGVLIRDGIIYSNATCVMDGRFDRGIINHGNIIEI